MWESRAVAIPLAEGVEICPMIEQPPNDINMPVLCRHVNWGKDGSLSTVNRTLGQKVKIGALFVEALQSANAAVLTGPQDSTRLPLVDVALVQERVEMMVKPPAAPSKRVKATRMSVRAI